MKPLYAIVLTGIIFIATTAHTHEGHNKLPGQIKALHGGIVKAGKEFNLEMLATGDSVQFFPVAHEGEEIKITDIKISGTSKTPKGKSLNLNFTTDQKSFLTKVDFAGAYRTNLEITTVYSGKSDSFKFLVEK